MSQEVPAVELQSQASRSVPPTDGSQWYKEAIIYQTHVRAFSDSDGDGIGDFRGLTARLDYIQDLGVTAIWLLPFYPSPLKDDGYDIADYTRVNPMYGTLADFKTFLKEAHRRGLRVITEMVLNHTSDQHEWFQQARRAKPGEKARDFYVWSDTTERYKDARIIFQDFETSNWTWDAVAGAYFWHRFYSHQPDLNYDNHDVHRAMLHALDFWLKLGVDGFRLDAIPYLYEREGTGCSNLPETHQFLKKLRAHVDAKFSGRMLLAEANEWPEDAIAFFGAGDECHMAFHFPLMPRLFMAVHLEDRLPVIDILQQTPPIPEQCQWTIFLRNHDELTLEMVTDEERDYMYRVYARDPEARINQGIRRRLAPLLGNNRRKIELMNGLLLSLPGTPVIYYGDELGMGDNIYLGDRDSVRTPMQWNADRNAGFSQGNPQRLYLPIISDPEFHYAALNVETQSNSPHSLLWWMKRLIGLRKRNTVFSRGTLEFLNPENTKILAFLRRHEDATVLVVANLSRFVQCVSIDLAQFQGRRPVELFGRTKFPPIDERPYFLTLGPHNFYWLSLEPVQRASEPAVAPVAPTIRVAGTWPDVFQGRARAALEATLPGFLGRHAWFGSRSRSVQAVEVLDVVDPASNGDRVPLRLVLTRVQYLEGEPDMYLLPLAYAEGEPAERIRTQFPGSVLVSVVLPGTNGSGVIYDAAQEPSCWSTLFEAVERRRRLKGRRGQVVPSSTRAFRLLRGPDDVPLTASVSRDAHLNSMAVFGDRLVMKLFRRLDAGVNPELELTRFLSEETTTTLVPAFAGALEYRAGRAEPTTFGILHEFKSHTVPAWRYTLDELGRFFERVGTELSTTTPGADVLPPGTVLDLAEREKPAQVVQLLGPYLHSVELLGQRTAELHLALTSRRDIPQFAPEPFIPSYQRGLYQSMRNLHRRVFQLLRRNAAKLPEPAGADATQIIGHEARILEVLRQITARKLKALRIRGHGDYHLGQVLYTGKDFVIIDFEGESARPISERRIKRSPLRDVASMLRSFHYASQAVFLGKVRGVAVRPQDEPAFGRWAAFWHVWTSATFLRSYLATLKDADILPSSRDELKAMLNAYLLERALYEVEAEMNNRQEWARIPLRGVLELLEGIR